MLWLGNLPGDNPARVARESQDGLEHLKPIVRGTSGKNGRRPKTIYLRQNYHFGEKGDEEDLCDLSNGPQFNSGKHLHTKNWGDEKNLVIPVTWQISAQPLPLSEGPQVRLVTAELQR